MKKLFMLALLALFGGLAYTMMMRRRAESVLPSEGMSGEVPLSTVPPMPGMS